VVPLVYYMMRSDRPGQVKIGTSERVLRRALQVRGGRREDRQLVLLAVEVGGRDVERKRHGAFDAMRLDGEWFTFGAPIISHVMQLDQVPVVVEEPLYDTYRMPLGTSG
jgi:hypothetical protein